MTKARANRPVLPPETRDEPAAVDSTEALMRDQLRDLRELRAIGMRMAEALGGQMGDEPVSRTRSSRGSTSSGIGFSRLMESVRQTALLEQHIERRLAIYLRRRAQTAAAPAAPRETRRSARPMPSRPKTVH